MRERKYPLLVVFKEKDGDRYFLVNNSDETQAAFRVVFEDRLRNGRYYSEEYLRGAKLDPENFTDKQAYYLMTVRCDYEYEGYEIVEPEGVS